MEWVRACTAVKAWQQTVNDTLVLLREAGSARSWINFKLHVLFFGFCDLPQGACRLVAKRLANLPSVLGYGRVSNCHLSATHLSLRLRHLQYITSHSALCAPRKPEPEPELEQFPFRFRFQFSTLVLEPEPELKLEPARSGQRIRPQPEPEPDQFPFRFRFRFTPTRRTFCNILRWKVLPPEPVQIYLYFVNLHFLSNTLCHCWCLKCLRVFDSSLP